MFDIYEVLLPDCTQVLLLLCLPLLLSMGVYLARLLVKSIFSVPSFFFAFSMWSFSSSARGSLAADSESNQFSSLSFLPLYVLALMIGKV